VKEFFVLTYPPGGGREKDNKKRKVNRKKKGNNSDENTKIFEPQLLKGPERVQQEETGAWFSRIVELFGRLAQNEP
jgi:hypothetical protein